MPLPRRRLRVHGLREVVALPVLATQFDRLLHLPGRLNAFCNHFQFHFDCQPGDQFHNVDTRIFRTTGEKWRGPAFRRITTAVRNRPTLVAQFEFLSALRGFPLRTQRLKCFDLPKRKEPLTAEYAERTRRVR